MSEADERFARWLDGGLDPEEEAVLLADLQADPALLMRCREEARCAAWLSAVHGDDRATSTADAVMQQIVGGSDSSRWRRAEAVMRRLPRRRVVVIRPWWIGVIAASLFLLLGVWRWTRENDSAATPGSPTAVGSSDEARGPCSLTIADGSRIELATGSDAVQHDGVWKLKSGVADITAAKTPTQRPAKVVLRTAEAEMAVHGTAFRVEATPGRSDIEVREGVVAVRGTVGTCLVPQGGRVAATASSLRGDLAWQTGDAMPPWLAVGKAVGMVLVGEPFADRFSTLGLDLRPVRLGMTADTRMTMRVRLSGGCPTLELWCRTMDGKAYCWEEIGPPQDAWLERDVPFTAFRDDATRTLAMPAHAVIDWLHISTRDGHRRTIEVERLAIAGFGPGGE